MSSSQNLNLIEKLLENKVMRKIANRCFLAYLKSIFLSYFDKFSSKIASKKDDFFVFKLNLLV